MEITQFLKQVLLLIQWNVQQLKWMNQIYGFNINKPKNIILSKKRQITEFVYTDAIHVKL